MVKFQIIPYKQNVYPVTKGRLNRMCKYFRNKRVNISYEYNNSMGHHSVCETFGMYDDFKIIMCGESFYASAEVRFSRGSEPIFTFGIDCLDCADFVGLGKINILNSGPYCYFRIKEISLLESLIDNI